ncbi:MAG: LysM peptidoglycan-binding domain-containing protein [Magnetococcales bacterium]|nr:LysM peptidoglycan-binding domain-containing protein [Magnetococcales bacterium]NGZ25964.1 LysM peptidoglycan-binding domain-containing protein [Magnetococcales bacterium]
MYKVVVCSLILALLAATPVVNPCLANGTSQQESSPFKVNTNGQPYQVVSGDTLWGISGRFLKDPWLWPEVWRNNQHIANPHLIYPGDLIYLNVDTQGRPSFTIKRGESGKGQQVTLVPEVVVSPVQPNDNALTATQRDDINLYLRRNSIIAANNMTGVGHIVAPTKNHLALGEGETILLSLNDRVFPGEILAVYRNGKPLIHPTTQEMLGVMVEHVGMVRIEQITPQGPVARIIETYTEIEAMDRITWPINLDMNFQISYPQIEPEVRGAIVALQDQLSEVGNNQVVTVALGRENRLPQGSILTIYRAGRAIEDPARKGSWDLYPPTSTMPEEKIGTALLFYVGDKASFALLMRISESIKRGDVLANR